MATSFFYIYVMPTSFFYIYITFTNWRSVQSFFRTQFFSQKNVLPFKSDVENASFYTISTKEKWRKSHKTTKIFLKKNSRTKTEKLKKTYLI